MVIEITSDSVLIFHVYVSDFLTLTLSGFFPVFVTWRTRSYPISMDLFK